MDKQLKHIMSDVINMKESDINDHTSIKNVEQWDSLKHMELITAIEQHFGIMLAANEIAEMTSMAVIKKVLSSRINNVKEK